MKECFHFTKNRFLKSILEYGLQPKFGTNCSIIGDRKGEKIRIFRDFEEGGGAGGIFRESRRRIWRTLPVRKTPRKGIGNRRLVFAL